MLVTRFVKNQEKITVASKAECRKDMSRKIFVKESLTEPLPLIGRTFESSKTSNDDTKDKNEDKTSSHRHSKSSPRSKCGVIQHSDDFKVHKNEKLPKGVNVLRRVNSQLTAVLDFIN